MPRNSTDQFLTQKLGKDAAQKLLRHYLARCADAESRTSALQTVHRLAKIAWQKDEKSGLNYQLLYGTDCVDPAIVYDVLKAAIELREYTLFNNVMGYVMGRVGVKGIDSRILTVIKTATASGLLSLGHIKERCVFCDPLLFARANGSQSMHLLGEVRATRPASKPGGVVSIN